MESVAICWRFSTSNNEGARGVILPDFFRHRLGLREQIQIIGAAGFGIGAGHVEAAEGVGSYHGAGAFAVDVEIAHVEVAAGAVDLVAGLGVDCAGEAELGVVGDFEGVIEAAGFDDGENWSEDFFLLEF